MNDDPDLDWSPPSESEMKVIQAKRERADKISNLMGSYLLKGYKMLNETCPRCTTIYLSDPQGKLYCVACMEVDADTEKDNPATSVEAARRQVAESQFCLTRTGRPGGVQPLAAAAGATARCGAPPADGCDRPATAAAAAEASTTCQPASTTCQPASTTCQPASATCQQTSTTCQQTSGACQPASAWPADAAALESAAAAVRSRLVWATGALEACSSVEASCELVELIRSCADALQVLRRRLT